MANVEVMEITSKAEIYLITLENKIWSSLGCIYFPELGVIKARDRKYYPVPRLTSDLSEAMRRLEPSKVTFYYSKTNGVKCLLTMSEGGMSHTGTSTNGNHALAFCLAYEKHLTWLLSQTPPDEEEGGSTDESTP